MSAKTSQTMKLVEKPQDTRRTIRRLLGYMSVSRLLILVTVGIAVVATATTVVAPKILGGATTLIYDATRGGFAVDASRLFAILTVTASLYAVQFVCGFMQTRLTTVMAQRTSAALRGGLKAKMGKVPVSFYDRNATGNLMAVASGDTDNVANSIQQSVGELITNLITIVGMLAIMLVISWRLTVAAVVMVPLSFVVMRFFLPQSQRHMREFLHRQGRLNDHIEESYNGHAVIKCNNGEAAAAAAFARTNDAMYASGWKANFAGAFMMKTVMCFKNLVYVLIAIVGAMYVSRGTLVIGDLQAFLTYAILFSSPVTRLGLTFSEIVTGVASAERIFGILDAQEMRAARERSGHKSGDAKVSFSHVCFGYGDKPLMHDFSLDVHEGQMVAIVGHTGAGKTTLINLLEGFYEIDGGAICVDGTDIRSMGKAKLRRKIGMVLQDTWLFSGTIYDNIRYGNESASHEDVMAAAKAAFVDDFVRALPAGYDTVLNEDAGNISQGQRQLITIARAFVADPEILILDEATSNVDSRTEMLVQSAVKKLLAGRTSFVIAHRLSTIYGADNIIVMANGDIVETGSHLQLVRANGVYADIYNSQFAAV